MTTRERIVGAVCAGIGWGGTGIEICYAETVSLVVVAIGCIGSMVVTLIVLGSRHVEG